LAGEVVATEAAITRIAAFEVDGTVLDVAAAVASVMVAEGVTAVVIVTATTVAATGAQSSW
jgi:hypothetical protein